MSYLEVTWKLSKIETDSYGYIEEYPEDEYQETAIEMIDSDYECKDPLSASVWALSWKKIASGKRMNLRLNRISHRIKHIPQMNISMNCGWDYQE